MLSTENTTDRRHFERFTVVMDASVVVDSETAECTMYGIGEGGARVRLEDARMRSRCVSDLPVLLNVPGFGVFEGEVAWIDDELTGIRFFENHKAMVGLIAASADRARNAT